MTEPKTRLAPRRENPQYLERLAWANESDLKKMRVGADASVKQRIDFELVHRLLHRRNNGSG